MDLSLILQIVGTSLGLLYLWLEYKANIWLWVVGAIMPVVHGILYLNSGIYADAAMQLYYVLAAIYGIAVGVQRLNDNLCCTLDALSTLILANKTTQLCS